jgi:queuine tRNA-ribosyltransferase
VKSFLGLDLPLFMPDATLGAVRSLTTRQLEDTGVKMLVVNTLHLLLSVGIDRMRTLGGIKNLMGWKGKMLSDSGGFQVYSLIHRKNTLGKVTQYGVYFTSPRDGKRILLTPEISIDMQIALGTDVLVVLDDCRYSELKQAEAEESVANTTRWAKRAHEHFHSKYPEEANTRKLFAVVHGGMNKNLRTQSAHELMEIGFDGYCFGGWPVDSSGALVEETLGLTANLLPRDLPKYAMGVGKPEDMEKCHKLGYSMFDCVLPTRNARHGLLYTTSGELRITRNEFADDMRPIDAACGCETCRGYTRAYVHHLFKVREMTALSLATIHNVTFYMQCMKNLRESSH